MELPEKCFKWRCEDCKEIHGNEDEAKDCCAPSISEVVTCPVCNDAHDDEAQAFDCCGYGEDPDQPIFVSTVELELQGQTRLF